MPCALAFVTAAVTQPQAHGFRLHGLSLLIIADCNALTTMAELLHTCTCVNAEQEQHGLYLGL